MSAREIDEVLAIANDAAKVIMSVYATSFDVDYKNATASSA
jgi:hypothetical protein